MSHKRKTFPRKLLFCAVAAGLASNYTYAQQAQDPDIEQIIVTGSFIRGTPLDAPSPVQIINRDNIEAQGAAVIWDVIKNLEANSGSFADNGSGEVYGIEGTAQVNLRNLGENSTLTLINGKRMVTSGAVTRAGGEFVDLNAIPLVMTDRVEILTDGGSALYGADAVAGVVNVIMRTDFEGLEIYGDVQNIVEAGSAFDTTLSGIWGWASDDGDTHFVISAERFERDSVPITEGNFFDGNTFLVGDTSVPRSLLGSAFWGGHQNTAYINSDLRALNISELASAITTIYTDPLCTNGFTDFSGNPFFIAGDDPRQRAILGDHSGACVVDETQWELIAFEQERNSVAASFNHTFGDGTEFYSFFSWSDQETLRGGSGYVRSFGSTFLPSPGAYGEGSRGSVFELGHFAPLFGNPVPTITNNPTDIANGGPNAFYRSNMQGNIRRPGDDNDTNFSETLSAQFGLRGDFEFADREFNFDVSYSAGSSSAESQRRDFNRTNSHLASMGLGGPDCVPNGVSDFDFLHQPGPNGWPILENSLFREVFEGFFVQPYETISLGLTSSNQGQGNCHFYNPLLTRFTDPELANSPEMMAWLTQVGNLKDKRNTLGVFDAVVSGELFEMRGGTAAFAFGGQYRDRTAGSNAIDLNWPGIPAAIVAWENGVPSEFKKIDNNLSCSSCSFDWDLDRTVTAFFTELSLPFWENVETQFALRWEDYGDNIGSEVSPKVAVSWRPIDTLLLRASWSESFRAPNLGIIGAGLDAGLVTFLDPLNQLAVRAGLLPATPENAVIESSFTLGGPSPDVGNEFADTFNIGVIWTPSGALEGFSAQADIWRFEVTDRVLPESGNSAMVRQVAAFNEAVSDPNNYVENTSLDTNSPSGLYLPCDPNAPTAEFGVDSSERLNCVVDPRLYQVDGVEEDVPNPARNLIQLKLGAINAGEITADGVDLKLGYRWQNDWGRFNLGLDYTFVNQYKLANVPGLDNGLLDIGVYDAAGTTGDGNLVRSLPDHKGHITFNWAWEIMALQPSAVTQVTMKI
ncbi:MAG: TonB-dependent receptor [Gammaproteobacteria bacterium]|nr:TonB-dependent receptor [Gammaproteobacteria bacterium]